uniref:NADH-ubiquinone oxidoreductase chain 2 n=1 Tax=Polygraphus poligraphus TaxID=516982 RepID=A0A8F4WEW7_9CUCU|nr:NADH dehydrogenase subunit 2 [Polygraphus poligraphus]QXG82894.1 NADH dehydrogenase subunit 2 [Polygraphus poligraphus]UJX85648.1 NADH dehydrogenase subunit 2 [Polygraphus poligraphus]
MTNLFKILFFSTTILGTIVSISSISWFTAWMGLEINLISFIPLMKTNNKFTTEASMKYFMVQAMASVFLLFSIIIFTNSKEFSFFISETPSIFISSALFLKLGAAPFHFWFPETCSGLSWNINLILLTWQKIAPMMLIFISTKMPLFFCLIALASSLIGGIQGLNQTCLRKIMAYSSINHMGWMISAILNSFNNWLVYFLIYSAINFNIIMVFKKLNSFFIPHLSKMTSYSKPMKMFFSLNFLSLGGLPPFLGFLPKWITIFNLTSNKFFCLMILLIIFSLISLYFYLRITFSSLTLQSTESLNSFMTKMKFWDFFINSVSLLGLLLCSMIPFD